MIYKIVKYGDPVLETPAADWTEFCTAELHQLVADMFETMYANKGVGLAAPQIGISKRLAVIDVSAGEDESGKIVMLNPEILHRGGNQIEEEGCLSIPGFRETVKRALNVRVRAQDVAGNHFEMEGSELLARAFQHEIDHLNGVLFVRHISMLKRDLIRRKIRKLQKAGEWH